MDTIQGELLAEIERFIADRGISSTKFGIDAVGDGHLVRRLRANRSVTLRTAQRIREHIAKERSGPAAAKTEAA